MRTLVIGGGPAGMTAALLLARVGHQVSLFEGAPELGGLWASQRDPDGFFQADNSCKVYQPSYVTTPALFELLGMHWKDHFLPRHDLNTEWLRPFIRDSTAKDLSTLAAAFALQASGAKSFHEVPVGEFLEAAGMGEACKAWMRATALGGIAGTLRMTVWELFHRLGTNLDSVFAGTPGPLYWNARPPNSAGGFLTVWTHALVAAGVDVRLGANVRAISPRPGGGVQVSTGAESFDAEVLVLAVPPPALERLFTASDRRLAAGFGRSPLELARFLKVSRYEHLGITWHFDRPLPNPLPLGGHNVRRGWHPILVEHAQYRPHLRPPAVTAVVGSVAIDLDHRHARLGTRADAHSPDELARIVWEDEQRVDPSLPEPIAHHVAGVSAASQVVATGPLPMCANGIEVVLASGLTGEAPYFTASLETAVQAGALAAQAVDPRVERLPMRARRPLPWKTPRPLRTLELSCALPCSADDAWEVFTDTPGWARWSQHVLSLEGKLEPGTRWEVEVRGAGRGTSTLRPRLISLDPGRQLHFATELGTGWLVRMEHRFVFEDQGPGRCVLRQPFEISGALTHLAWKQIEPALLRFEAVGTDLARFLEIRTALTG